MKELFLLLLFIEIIGCSNREITRPRDHFGHSKKIILKSNEYSIIKKDERWTDQDKDDWLDESANYESIKEWTPLENEYKIELCDTVIIISSKNIHDEFSSFSKFSENPNWWIWKNLNDEKLFVRVRTDYQFFWIKYWNKDDEILVFKVNRIQ